MHRVCHQIHMQRGFGEVSGLHAAWITNYDDGIADLGRGGQSTDLASASPYDWDRRNFRDRALGLTEPLSRSLPPRRDFEHRPDLTWGVVTRVMPINQFSLLFSHLAPLLPRDPGVNVESFDSGGNASVRDLRRVPSPVAPQLPLWGEKSGMCVVHRQIDALLTGLPAKKALGLKVVETQFCGVPVFAPDALPVDETALDGVTGLRYRDPRKNWGADFGCPLEHLRGGGFQFDMAAALDTLGVAP